MVTGCKRDEGTVGELGDGVDEGWIAMNCASWNGELEMKVDDQW